MSTIYYENSPSFVSSAAAVHQVQSLVERKKQQWAKEREELAGFNDNAPWGSRDSLQLYDRPYIKTRYVTKYQKENEYLRRDSSYSTSSSATSSSTRRQPHPIPPTINNLLPPLYKNQNFTYTPDEKSDKEMGGETSGYGSDNAHHTPDHFPQTRPRHHHDHEHHEHVQWSSTSLPGQQHHIVNTNHATNTQHSGYESSSSGREDRLKWGDRGVHLGKFWDGGATNKEVNNPVTDATPGWVKRGLERDTELVVNNNSPAESPEQVYEERPGTSSSSLTNSNGNRCFIRGQNVPVEPAELAERERRRQIALAHQDAIRQQLEEREKKRQDERARRLREEYEEEMRIAREQEVERQRQKQEQLQRLEKEERDRKRKEALREAIEIAEKEAKEEKLKQRLMRQNQFNLMAEHLDKAFDKDLKSRKNQNNQLQLKDQNEENKENKKEVNSKEIYDLEKGKKNEELHINNKNNRESDLVKDKDNDKQLVIVPRDQDKNFSNSSNSVSNSESGDSESSVPSSAKAITAFQGLTQENLAVILQNPLGESFQNVQFVLIPTMNPLNSSIPLPMSLMTPMSMSTSSVQTQVVPMQVQMPLSTTRTENRLLTPTQYRNKTKSQGPTNDSSTQTDFPDYRKDLCDKLKEANIEICYERSRSRKERRSRSEMRHGEFSETGAQERPKWGVNRPPTRYLKQSEKDPLYQRRKLRQKMKIKSYDDKRYSSDDSPSQTGSPRTYRKKRGVWRKDDALYAENIKVYQTEIIPLDSDKDHIYVRTRHQCCCRCVGSGPGPGYQSTREQNGSRVDIMKIETPREYRDKLPACNNHNNMSEEGLLDKLSSIHNDLMLKDKDNWDERSQLLYSPSPSLCRNP